MIGNANPLDVDEILRIGREVLFDPLRHKPYGSIGYVLTPEEYLHRISGSSFFYVSRQNRNLNGFLMCYDDKFLTRLIQNGEFHHDGIVPYLTEQKRPFIYGESIAIEPNSARRAIGSKLMGKLFQDMTINQIGDIYVLLRHGPIGNTPSIEFCKKIGFSFAGVEIKNQDRIFTWGIYRRSLN